MSAIPGNKSFTIKGAFVYFDHPVAILDALPEHAGIYYLAKFEYFHNGVSPELSLNNLQGVVTFPSFQIGRAHV